MIDTLKSLFEHETKPRSGTFHCVVKSATYAELERRPPKMGIARFLVDKLEADVNGTDVPIGEKRLNRKDTPIGYGVLAKEGGGMMRRL